MPPENKLPVSLGDILRQLDEKVKRISKLSKDEQGERERTRLAKECQELVHKHFSSITARQMITWLSNGQFPPGHIVGSLWIREFYSKWAGDNPQHVQAIQAWVSQKQQAGGEPSGYALIEDPFLIFLLVLHDPTAMQLISDLGLLDLCDSPIVAEWCIEELTAYMVSERRLGREVPQELRDFLEQIIADNSLLQKAASAYRGTVQDVLRPTGIQIKPLVDRQDTALRQIQLPTPLRNKIAEFNKMQVSPELLAERWRLAIDCVGLLQAPLLNLTSKQLLESVLKLDQSSDHLLVHQLLYKTYQKWMESPEHQKEMLAWLEAQPIKIDLPPATEDETREEQEAREAREASEVRLDTLRFALFLEKSMSELSPEERQALALPDLTNQPVVVEVYQNESESLIPPPAEVSPSSSPLLGGEREWVIQNVPNFKGMTDDQLKQNRDFQKWLDFAETVARFNDPNQRVSEDTTEGTLKDRWDDAKSCIDFLLSQPLTTQEQIGYVLRCDMSYDRILYRAWIYRREYLRWIKEFNSFPEEWFRSAQVFNILPEKLERLYRLLEEKNFTKNLPEVQKVFAEIGFTPSKKAIVEFVFREEIEPEVQRRFQSGMLKVEDLEAFFLQAISDGFLTFSEANALANRMLENNLALKAEFSKQKFSLARKAREEWTRLSVQCLATAKTGHPDFAPLAAFLSTSEGKFFATTDEGSEAIFQLAKEMGGQGCPWIAHPKTTSECFQNVMIAWGQLVREARGILEKELEKNPTRLSSLLALLYPENHAIWTALKVFCKPDQDPKTLDDRALLEIIWGIRTNQEQDPTKRELKRKAQAEVSRYINTATSEQSLQDSKVSGYVTDNGGKEVFLSYAFQLDMIARLEGTMRQIFQTAVTFLQSPYDKDQWQGIFSQFSALSRMSQEIHLARFSVITFEAHVRVLQERMMGSEAPSEREAKAVTYRELTGAKAITEETPPWWLPVRNWFSKGWKALKRLVSSASPSTRNPEMDVLRTTSGMMNVPEGGPAQQSSTPTPPSVLEQKPTEQQAQLQTTSLAVTIPVVLSSEQNPQTSLTEENSIAATTDLLSSIVQTEEGRDICITFEPGQVGFSISWGKGQEPIQLSYVVPSERNHPPVFTLTNLPGKDPLTEKQEQQCQLAFRLVAVAAKNLGYTQLDISEFNEHPELKKMATTFVNAALGPDGAVINPRSDQSQVPKMRWA